MKEESHKFFKKKSFLLFLVFVLLLGLNFGSSVNLVFNEAVAQTTEGGKIEIRKMAREATSGEVFSFVSDFGNFELAANEDVVVELPAGNYRVQEMLDPGWQIFNIDCRGDIDGQMVVDEENARVDIDLDNNEFIKCYFYNEKNEGGGEVGTSTISVEKFIDSDGLASTTDDRYLASTTQWDFMLFDGISTTEKTSVEGKVEFSGLNAGVYYVSEKTKTGYGIMKPINNLLEVVLGAGEDKMLQFVNYRLPDEEGGEIIVKKYIDVDGLASTTGDRFLASSTDWTFDIEGAATSTMVSTDGQAVFSSLAAGKYFLSEQAKTGYSILDPVDNLVEVDLDENESLEVEFVNSLATTSELASITVRKFVDNDGLASTTGDRTLVDIAWDFSLFDGVSTTTKSTSNGQLVFTGLEAGNYLISEGSKSGWQFVMPEDGIASTSLETGENKTIDFVNYQEPDDNGNGGGGNGGDNGDDGTVVNGGGGGSGGSGGGGGGPFFDISNERALIANCDSISIGWRTNYAAVGRIAWDTESHSGESGSQSNNFAYANSATATTSELLVHSVSINNLDYGTTYYVLPVSEYGGNIYTGNELTVSTLPVEECVAGEVGSPELIITKSIEQDFVDPGENELEYVVVVENLGNLAAFNVVVEDILPEGFSFSDISGNEASRAIGDLAPGASSTIYYYVDVDENIEPDIYTNVAMASADNHLPVEDMASVSVREGEVLAASGFSMKDMLAVLVTSLALFASAGILRRRRSYVVKTESNGQARIQFN